jgi:transcriptional regulator with XRE-family HTH domain
MHINSNIKFLRERKGLTQDEFANAIGNSRSNVKNYEHQTIPPADVLITISDHFNISIDTLLRIDLRKLSELKLRELEAGNDDYVKGTNLRVIPITVDKSNRDNIELVPVKAKAGYTRGFNDPEFIATLPTFQLPFLSSERKYRGFPVDGESMYPIPDKAYVIGEYVENWESIKDGQAYVLILEGRDDLVFKILYNQVKKKRNVLAKSINRDFKDYEIPITEIREVWKFVNYISAELPENVEDISSLRKMLVELKSDVGKIVESQK